MMETPVLLFSAIFISAAYLLILMFLFKGLLSLKPSGLPANLTYSVIIAAHNEESCIENCLKHVFSQTISSSRYEVILALDRCTDQTLAIASKISAPVGVQFRILEIDTVPDGIFPKKFALIKAIDMAKNEVMVLTDADCTVPSTWLDTIDRNFSEKVLLVQGITTYEKIPSINRLLYSFQAVDFMSHAVVSAAAIGAGVPLNSNANNLSFRRETFLQFGGYGKKADIVSGDDDLLVQIIHKRSPGSVRYMIDPAGAVKTLPTPTARGVFEQRKRWGSKTVHYGVLRTGMLSVIFLFYVMNVVFAVAGFANPSMWFLFLLLFGAKIAGEYLLMVPGTKLMGGEELRKFIIPASLIQLLMVIAAVISGVFGKFTWKGTEYRRKV